MLTSKFNRKQSFSTTVYHWSKRKD